MADTPGVPFEQVWNELKANDTTGAFEQAEKLSLVTVEALEFAYNNGYKQGQADALAQANKKNPDSEWKDIYGDGDVHCTNCKAIIEQNEPHRNYYFCYHCGRKMKNGTNPFGR